MGVLVNGIWHQDWVETPKDGDKFVRSVSIFRHWITADSSSNFPAEKGRYHLYISLACPWASRALIFRKLKKLEDVISLSIVDPISGEQGWTFTENEGCIPDTVNHLQYMHQLYTLDEPKYSGRVTVPVLWDKQTRKIVNNESSEIIRMLNSEFNNFTNSTLDLYPTELQGEIDSINRFVYENINNGVYRCGFAGGQAAYEEAFEHLFNALDEIEARLSRQEYLVGNILTEADWRLFTTLVRFDAVYYSLFKCNKRHLWDYPSLQRYLQNLYHYPGIAETVDFDHIKRHYYGSLIRLNPSGIIPKGPEFHL